VARLRINYGSKDSLYKIAENLGFWDYISSSEDERSRNRKSLLEDSLEAFMGATEMILNKKFCNGVGYAVVYDIMKKIFDGMDISLIYEDLFDPKTRLKELFDFYNSNIYITDFVTTIAGEKKSFSIPVEVFSSLKKKDRRIEVPIIGLHSGESRTYIVTNMARIEPTEVKKDDDEWIQQLTKILFPVHGGHAMRAATPLGVLYYQDEKREDIRNGEVFNINYSTVYRAPHQKTGQRLVRGANANKHNGINIGEGHASLKADAQQRAAGKALNRLNSEGYIKAVPEFYLTFCK